MGGNPGGQFDAGVEQGAETSFLPGAPANHADADGDAVHGIYRRVREELHRHGVAWGEAVIEFEQEAVVAVIDHSRRHGLPARKEVVDGTPGQGRFTR